MFWLVPATIRSVSADLLLADIAGTDLPVWCFLKVPPESLVVYCDGIRASGQMVSLHGLSRYHKGIEKLLYTA